MGKDASLTPKLSVTFSKLGPGFSQSNIGTGLNLTLKAKKQNLTVSLAGTDNTLRDIQGGLKKKKDLVASADLKLHDKLTLNSSYELETGKYKVGGTFDGPLLDKKVCLKSTYSKDGLIAGEATATINKSWKVNATFNNQKKLLTAKYIVSSGDFTYEPAYNFVTKAPSIAVTKKHGKGTVKLSYDLKSKAGALELNQKPFKLVLSGPVAKGTKPNLQLIHEDVFQF